MYRCRDVHPCPATSFRYVYIYKTAFGKFLYIYTAQIIHLLQPLTRMYKCKDVNPTPAAPCEHVNLRRCHSNSCMFHGSKDIWEWIKINILIQDCYGYIYIYIQLKQSNCCSHLQKCINARMSIQLLQSLVTMWICEDATPTPACFVVRRTFENELKSISWSKIATDKYKYI